MTEEPSPHPFYPVPEAFDPDTAHRRLVAEAPRRLRWSKPDDLELYVSELREALSGCLGDRPPPVPLKPEVGEPEEIDGLIRRRATFAVEEGQRAPGWLLTRPDLENPAPAVICLQGHSSGAHISAGIARLEGDAASIAGERDFALRAARRGHVALALEQRCFGERSDGRPAHLRGLGLEHPLSDERCRHQAMVALLAGRTLLGERVHDVRRALDFLETLPEVDAARVACMGNSGGGTAAFYAACMDERIHACMPSCAFCTYADSICRHDHCSDNYLPGALRHFDMPDLAALVAPRPMVVVSGREDPLFPREGVLAAVDTARDIYRAFDAGDRLAHVEGDGGHRFYASAAWEAFDRATRR